jgi:hypothetical protein
MLSNFLINILKPAFGFAFFTIFFLVFIFSSVNFYLSFKRKKSKIPFAIIFISAFNISLGAACLIVMFLINEGGSFVYVLIAKFGLLLFSAVNIFFGTILIKFKPYAKLLILWFLAIFAISDVILTLTTEYSKYTLALMGFYLVVFTMYYFGLGGKHFKKEEESFSLRDDAAKKKEHYNITDFFKE